MCLITQSESGRWTLEDQYIAWWQKGYSRPEGWIGVDLRAGKGKKLGCASSNYGEKQTTDQRARSDDLTSDLCTPLDSQRVRAF